MKTTKNRSQDRRYSARTVKLGHASYDRNANHSAVTFGEVFMDLVVFI